tara:strand:+ start:1265 stop:1747 length:483 start_codon:yes stop_codon:yes gene_type:complete
VSRPGRNRRIVDTSGETISSGLERIDTKLPEHETTDGAVVITCKGDAPSKSDFLANPPEKIIFRVDGYHETVCTRLENKEQWVTYLLDITGESIYNVLFIFKEPCIKQRRLVERRRMPGYWQIIPIDPIRSDEFGVNYNMDITLKHFALIGFNLYWNFID